MATSEVLTFDAPHPPTETGLESFVFLESTIKDTILKSRQHWNRHEPKMWSRAAELSDEELLSFDLQKDVVEVRSATSSYGQIVLGKIRIPALEDAYVHVRIHDPPNKGNEDVKFHSLFTDEGNPDADGRPTTFNALMTRATPLEFFHE